METKIRPIKIIRPEEIHAIDGETDSEKNFYYTRERYGLKKCYSYKYTYSYETWKNTLNEVGITWEDIKEHKMRIKIFPGTANLVGLQTIKFEKVR